MIIVSINAHLLYVIQNTVFNTITNIFNTVTQLPCIMYAEHLIKLKLLKALAYNLWHVIINNLKLFINHDDSYAQFIFKF